MKDKLTERPNGIFLARYCKANADERGPATPNAHLTAVYLDGGLVERCIEANATEGWAKTGCKDGKEECLLRGEVLIVVPLHGQVGPDRRPAWEFGYPVIVTVEANGHVITYEYETFGVVDAEGIAECLRNRISGCEDANNYQVVSGKHTGWLRSISYGKSEKPRCSWLGWLKSWLVN